MPLQPSIQTGNSYPSGNMYEQAVVRLIQSSNTLQSQLQQYLNQYNLTIQQFNILRILSQSKVPVSLCRIKSLMFYKMPDTSRLVKRLSEKGLLKRESCCNDKRLIDIALTDEGKELLTQVESQLPDYTSSLFTGLSEDECRLLCRLLDKVKG